MEGNDADHDGLADVAASGDDVNHNGLDDALESALGGDPAATQDLDGDMIPDFRDTDDDEDGIDSADELTDADTSGVPDYLEAADSIAPDAPVITGPADG